MTYLITNREGDIIDVLDFNSDKEIKEYLDNNPNHSVDSAEVQDNLTFEDDDFLTDEIDLEFGEIY